MPVGDGYHSSGPNSQVSHTSAAGARTSTKAWNRRRYYTRSRRVNGRVVREYVGSGLIGQMDAADRERRLALKAKANQARAEVKLIDGDFQWIEELADVLVHAALVAAGYHRHNRGEWRRKREHDEPATSDGAGGDKEQVD